MIFKKIKMYDLIIVGGGPAGIAACLYAARQKMNFVLVTKDIGGLANFIPQVETYLGYYYLSGFDLMKKFEEHLKNFKTNLRNNEIVEKIDKTKGGFVITTDKGNYFGRAVIIASGRRFKKLDVSNEEKFENKGVSYCAACDGPLFKGKTVAVIGGGRSGLLSTLFIKDMMKKVYLIEIQSQLGGTEAWRQAVKKANNIQIILKAKTKKFLGNEKINGLEMEVNGKEKILNVDGIFVEIGYTPNTDFVKNLVKLNDRGEIVVDKENRTNVMGIFAAGDCTDIREKQVIVSAGEGAKALLSALAYLGAAEKTAQDQSMMK